MCVHSKSFRSLELISCGGCVHLVGEGNDGCVFVHSSGCNSKSCGITEFLLRWCISTLGLCPPAFVRNGQFALRISKRLVPHSFMPEACVSWANVPLVGCECSCVHALKPFLGRCFTVPTTITDSPDIAGMRETLVMPNFLTIFQWPRTGPTIACEIKPKRMWHPPAYLAVKQVSAGVEEEFELPELKRVRCRYSIMQPFKNADYSRNYKLGYCPNLLLSRPYRDLERALLALAERRRHMRLWTDGAKADLSIMQREEIRLVLRAALVESHVLDVVASLQQRCEMDVTLLAPLTRRALAYTSTGNIEAFCQDNAFQPCDEEWSCYAMRSEDIEDRKCGCLGGDLPTTHRNLHGAYVPIRLSDVRQMVKDFYVSMTASDLSIMVAMAPADQEGVSPFHQWNDCKEATATYSCRVSHPIDVDEGDAGVVLGVQVTSNKGSATYVVVIGVVDLASKRHKTLSHYATLEWQAINSATGHLA